MKACPLESVRNSGPRNLRLLCKCKEMSNGKPKPGKKYENIAYPEKDKGSSCNQTGAGPDAGNRLFDCILIALAAPDLIILQSDFPASRPAPSRSGCSSPGR